MLGTFSSVHAQANIIGKPIPIPIQYTLQIAQTDFPNQMNWEDAKKACEALGEGWRLPSKDELNSMYDDALIFRNNEYNTNDNFKGFNETNETYGNANLNDFKASGPQTQQEKIVSLYNSNEYLPNNNLLDKKLTKGFQILDNPVSVSNPNLIPVLKSIPVSSVLGSNKNQTYDIRAEPPCPKTVVSPFLNSSIMPDIYSTQRGCL